MNRRKKKKIDSISSSSHILFRVALTDLSLRSLGSKYMLYACLRYILGRYIQCLGRLLCIIRCVCVYVCVGGWVGVIAPGSWLDIWLRWV